MLHRFNTAAQAVSIAASIEMVVVVAPLSLFWSLVSWSLLWSLFWLLL